MKIIKDSSIYVIGEVLNKFLPFLLLPFLSRKLGTAGFGELSYYESCFAFIALLVFINQDNAIVRYFYTYGQRSLNLVVSTSYIYTLIMGGIFLVICSFLHSAILMYIVVSVVFQTLIKIQLSIRQCYKQAFAYTSLQLFSSILAFVLTIILLELFTTHLVELRFIAVLLGNAIAFFVSYFLFQKNQYRKLFSFKQYKIAMVYLLAFGIPLFFHQFSDFLKLEFAKIVIYKKFSAADLGIYGMGFKLSLIITVLIVALNKAIVPYYFESLQHKRLSLAKIRKFVLISLAIVPFAMGIIYMLPESLFLWVLGAQFMGVKYYFMLLATAALLGLPYLLLINYLFYFGNTSRVAVIATISAIIYVVALFAFIELGIKYVPWANIISALVNLPLAYVFVRRVESFK